MKKSCTYMGIIATICAIIECMWDQLLICFGDGSFSSQSSPLAEKKKDVTD